MTIQLNVQQKKAVDTLNGAVLILAGAGTGKTATIVERIANLILSSTAHPSEILAVTFTNKAAKELRERIANRIDEVNGMWIGTFHGLSLRILRMYYQNVGLGENFIILDDTDKKRVLKNLINQLELDETRFSVNILSFIISGLKGSGVRPFDSKAINEFQYNGLDIELVYNTYHQNIRGMNAVDFDDLIFECVNLFQQFPQILNDIQERLKYIVVDEYQDTNKLQHQWLSLLASKYQNICCVGDEDQSIYGWRGAEIKYILNFPKEFPGAQLINLEENYRSTQEILSAAVSLISNNTHRYSKVLFSSSNGVKPEVIITEDSRKECYHIVRKISQLNNVCSYSKMAILVRASYQMKSIEDVFIQSGVPYKIIDGTRFYDRKEIKDLISYIRFLYSPSDVISFERIINTPKRGIGDKSVSEILAVFAEHKAKYGNNIINLLEDVEQMDNILSSKGALQIKAFATYANSWRQYIVAKCYSVREIVDLVYTQSGYLQMLKEEVEKNPAEANRIENVREFISSLEEFANMEEFLEYISLLSMSDDSNNEDCVNIMTIHAAKGLEFDYVFLPCWDEDLFPNRKSIEENGENGLEEERRLAYVALTRAKKMFYIYSTRCRLIFGRLQLLSPSRFISNIKNFVTIIDQTKAIEQSKEYGYTTSIGKGASATIQLGAKITKQTELAITAQHSVFGKGSVITMSGDFAEVQFADGIRRKIRKDFLNFNK